MSRTRLVLVRHGQTDWNFGGRFQGQADVELNDVGIEQARLMAPYLAALQPAAVLSSDLKRASVTAQHIADACGLGVVHTDPRLQEINVGSWVGLRSEDVRRDLPWFDEKLREGIDFRRSDSGETGQELADRVGPALAEIGEAFAGRTAVVVGHGMALRHGLMRLLGWDARVGLSLTGLWNCSWTVVERRDRWTLLSYNNVVPGTASLPSLNAP